MITFGELLSMFDRPLIEENRSHIDRCLETAVVEAKRQGLSECRVAVGVRVASLADAILVQARFPFTIDLLADPRGHFYVYKIRLVETVRS